MVALLFFFGNWFFDYVGVFFLAQLNFFLLLIFVIMLFFLLMVLFTMIYVVLNKNSIHFYGHKKSPLETISFFTSSFSIFVMSIPSLYLLFFFSSGNQANLTVKVVASQWYWSYEISNLMEDPILMYMLPFDDLSMGSYLYLEVDNRLVLPNDKIQFFLTSTDVIHSFGLPTLSLKVDATPGLLSVLMVELSKVGVHYGQCYEICGMNHSYMPFVIEVVPFQSFLYWCL